MHDVQLLVLAPLSLLLGVPLGLLKEKLRKHSFKRLALALAPFALAPLLSARDGAVLAGTYYFGRALGASLIGVGLTGGIATGKSTVSKAFREAGAAIVDADVVARDVVVPGRGAYKEIVRCFGTGVLHEDATINRAKLGEMIFSDPTLRKRLNSATHKYIIWEMFKQLVYQRLVCRKRLVVFDAPLLFETKVLEYFCYPTIVVACSEKNELARLMSRDNMQQEEAQKRIKSQMRLHEKVAKADLVILNDGSLDDLQLRTQEILERTAFLEKRERILHIYHESKEVFNLKEMEKLGSKAGIVLQTVKDVNQALVDDALVDCDKIGSGNYFWSFPSKLSQSRKRKLSELEQRRQTVQEKVVKVQQSIEDQKAVRSESDERVQNLRRLEEQKAKVQALRTKVQHMAENDPAILDELERKVYNVYTLKSWVVKKRGVEGKEVDKWLGIKDDFDYVE
ncbi:Dephospho-CoA kinase [Phytophthora megakarya]|uniref:Dephospho-CoA kinase n=1 Tax=Phytophthora megakarya TaxID=4795 RepID=A0A225WAD4_9STRA|nr:Dephospho-CoA kinase [Phytophthora megakarya]